MPHCWLGISAWDAVVDQPVPELSLIVIVTVTASDSVA
jgi:hypothetical protein